MTTASDEDPFRFDSVPVTVSWFLHGGGRVLTLVFVSTYSDLHRPYFQFPLHFSIDHSVTT